MDLENYLTKKRKEFDREYKNSRGETPACIFVALEIAKYLILDFKQPYIIELNGPLKKDGVNSESFYPLKHSGEVTWYAHFTCCEKGLIYDPLSDKILPINDFCKKVFGKKLNSNIVLDYSETRKKVFENFRELIFLAD